MTNAMLREAIESLVAGDDLDAATAADVLREVMEGRASEIEVAGFLIALRAKGETVDELTGLARTMRELAVPVACERPDLLDTAGTGGGFTTFNVSTTAALIAAAAGCAVAKHGNRSSTSLSGSADLLEALGARIDLDPTAVARCIDEIGFGFMFAPAHHSAMRHVVPVRQALGVRTTFNVLGPLTNPAAARRQLIGVWDPTHLERIAGALAQLGTHRALVVSSEDGLDEMSTSAPTRIVEVDESGSLRSFTFSPQDAGLDLATLADLAGDTPERNAQTTRSILGGERGSPRDLAVLNAGTAIYVAGRAETIEAGTRRAEQAIDDGSALRTLGSLVERSAELAGAGAAS